RLAEDDATRAALEDLTHGGGQLWIGVGRRGLLGHRGAEIRLDDDKAVLGDEGLPVAELHRLEDDVPNAAPTDAPQHHFALASHEYLTPLRILASDGHEQADYGSGYRCPLASARRPAHRTA